MRIVITGAAGKIGRQLVEELTGGHDLFLLDRLRMNEKASMVANLAKNRVRSILKPWSRERLPRWMRRFEGADVVIHLAAYLRHDLNWTRVFQDNIQATWNVFQAAVQYRVPRVVFASSNWSVKGLEMELAPACYDTNGPKISSAAEPRPKTLYGISKAFGEIAGRTLVEEGQMESFVSVRIGSYHPVCPTKQDPRNRWIGSKDIRSLFRRCVEADFKGYHVVYGVSALPISPYDLSHTCCLLSWKPEERP